MLIADLDSFTFQSLMSVQLTNPDQQGNTSGIVALLEPEESANKRTTMATNSYALACKE